MTDNPWLLDTSWVLERKFDLKMSVKTHGHKASYWDVVTSSVAVMVFLMNTREMTESYWYLTCKHKSNLLHFRFCNLIVFAVLHYAVIGLPVGSQRMECDQVRYWKWLKTWQHIHRNIEIIPIISSRYMLERWTMADVCQQASLIKFTFLLDDLRLYAWLHRCTYICDIRCSNNQIETPNHDKTNFNRIVTVYENIIGTVSTRSYWCSLVPGVHFYEQRSTPYCAVITQQVNWQSWLIEKLSMRGNSLYGLQGIALWKD